MLDAIVGLAPNFFSVNGTIAPARPLKQELRVIASRAWPGNSKCLRDQLYEMVIWNSLVLFDLAVCVFSFGWNAISERVESSFELMLCVSLF